MVVPQDDVDVEQSASVERVTAERAAEQVPSPRSNRAAESRPPWLRRDARATARSYVGDA